MAQPAEQIRFCRSRDGTRIAYAICGSGPPLMRAPHWMSNIDLDWESPVWGHWLALMARHHTLIRYDHRGCGLSDRDGVAFSFDKFLEDFEAVVEAAGLQRFDLFGFAGGATTGIAYAVRHPQRVGRFVIHGCNVQGPLVPSARPKDQQAAENQLRAIELGWPNNNPAFRQLFTSMLIPDGTAEQFRSFNEHIRLTTPPANGKKIIEIIWRNDITPMAARLRCPTLIFHSRHDGRIPFEQGRALAGLIPGARFVPLESQNHLILETEPAWQQVVRAVEDFLPAIIPPAPLHGDLTARENEVLELLAQGLDNDSIARKLGTSAKTVRNQVSIIFSKLGVNSRAQAVVLARDSGFGRKTAD